MTGTIKKSESKIKSFFKSVLTIILVLFLFTGMQSFVAGIVMGVDLANAVTSGELPYEIFNDYDEFTKAILKSAEKINENALQVSLVSNLLTILIICLSFTIRKKSPIDGMDVKSISFFRIISLLVFGVVLQVFVTIVLGLIPFPKEILDEHSAAYDVFEINDSIFLQIISSGLVTGIAEELVFRGVITNHLRRYMHPAIAVTISALIFGMLHPSTLAMVYATVIGIILGALYIKYDSVVPSILCHIAFNSMSCLLGVIPEEGAFIILILFFMSIPTLVYLIRSIFFNYPNAGDLLFDDKGRIKPRSPEEAEVITKLRLLKESGQITERDFKQIDRDWEKAKKAKKRKPTPTPTATENNVITNTTVTENNENKGDSNNDETL